MAFEINSFIDGATKKAGSVLGNAIGSNVNVEGTEKALSVIGTVAKYAALMSDLIPGYGDVPRLEDPANRNMVNAMLPTSQDRYEAYDMGGGGNAIGKLLGGKNDSGVSDAAGMKSLMRKYAKLAGEVEAGDKYREKENKFIRNFYEEKTIMPEHLFVACFVPTPVNEDVSYSTEHRAVDLNPNGSHMIKPHHVKSISYKVLPSDIDVEKNWIIPFPVVNVNNISYEFSVTFEEDAKGSVFTFLQWAYRRVINDSLYHNISNNRIGDFNIVVYNIKDDMFQSITYHNVFIKSAGDVSHDYSSTNARSYNCSFQATHRSMITYNFNEAINLAKTVSEAMKPELLATRATDTLVTTA